MTHNAPDKEDLRVQRTHRLILDALIELTTETGFAAITVRDLCQRAGINRATFYRHYQDKFDLLDRYAQEVYALLDAPAPKGASPATGLVRLFDHIRTNARFYRVILGQHGDPAFTEKVRQYVERRMGRALPAALTSDPQAASFYLSCLSSSSLGALLWWLEHDLPYTSEEMADISFRLGAAHLAAMLELAKPRTSPQTPVRRGQGAPRA